MKNSLRLIGLVFFILVHSMVGFSQAIIEEKPVKKVLILHSDEEFIPANIDINSALVSQLKRSDKFAVTIYSEYMDDERFYNETQLSQYKEDFIERYTKINPDVIIAIDYKAFTFLKTEVKEFYERKPLVFCMIPKRLIDEPSLPENIAGNYMSIDAKGSIDLVMHMHPNTREIVIVSGAGKASKSKLDEINDNLLNMNHDVEISFLQDKSIKDTLDTLANLNENTVVLYNSIFVDKEGESFIPREALALMNDATSVPIYGLYFTNLDYGLVGGSLFEFKEVAKDAANKTLKILAGVKPSSLPILEVENKRYFNWALFEKWGINEADLPEDIILLNKEFTIWESYKYQIMGMIVFVIVETLLIFYLMLQQVLRKKAEQALNKLNSELEVTVSERTDSLNQSNIELEDKNALLKEEIDIRISVEDELKSVVKTLSETQNQLIAIEKQAVVNHLIQNLLHRINTPLGNTLLYLDVLDKEKKDSDTLANIVDQLKLNNKQLVSTMATLNSMLYIDNDEMATEIDLEEYMPKLLHEVFLSSKSDIVAVCYPNQVAVLKENNFKKVIMSLTEFARGQRLVHVNLKRAEIIFDLSKGHLKLYYKDEALDTINDVEKIFDPYVFSSFKSTPSGLELVVLYNSITVGMQGTIKLIEGEDKKFNRILEMSFPI